MTLHFLREMDRLNQQLITIGERVEKQVSDAYEAITRMDVTLAHRVIKADETVDNVEVRMEEECLKLLALYQPVAIDLRLIIAILKINNDLERIGDHAANIATLALKLAEQPPVEVPEEMTTIYRQAKLMLRKSLLSFVEADQELAGTILEMDKEIDALCRVALPEQIELIKQDPEKTEQRLMLITACRQLERIGDHASNIAEDVVYLLSGDIIRHGSGETLTVRTA